MKKVLLPILLIALASASANAERVLVRYYGTYATQSTVNPCAGETNRVCAEKIVDQIITTSTGDGKCATTVKFYDADGKVISTQTFTNNESYEQTKLDIIGNPTTNSTIMISDDDEEIM